MKFYSAMMGSDKLNIVVTGCGGDIGQSVGKILKEYYPKAQVIGCDMGEDNPAKFIFDRTYKLPRCDSSEYAAVLGTILKDEYANLLIPVSEPELRRFTDLGVDQSFLGIPLLIANLRARQIGFDKLQTARFLERSALPFPRSEIVNEVNRPFFPMVLKNNTGSGSKFLTTVETAEDFDFYKKKFPGFLAQEAVGRSSEEYTCGLFRSKSGNSRSLIFKRTLQGGYSNFGYVVHDQSIAALLEKIADGLALTGSINVQLRLTERGPVVFEINPRFSSTVRFRHMLGFKDLVWSIEDAMNQSISSYQPPAGGRKFYKGYYEYVD
jgi:carbamoyl-phosphate synthase large subunit